MQGFANGGPGGVPEGRLEQGGGVPAEAVATAVPAGGPHVMVCTLQEGDGGAVEGLPGGEMAEVEGLIEAGRTGILQCPSVVKYFYNNNENKGLEETEEREESASPLSAGFIGEYNLSAQMPVMRPWLAQRDRRKDCIVKENELSKVVAVSLVRFAGLA